MRLASEPHGLRNGRRPLFNPARVTEHASLRSKQLAT